MSDYIHESDRPQHETAEPFELMQSKQAKAYCSALAEKYTSEDFKRLISRASSLDVQDISEDIVGFNPADIMKAAGQAFARLSRSLDVDHSVLREAWVEAVSLDEILESIVQHYLPNNLSLSSRTEGHNRNKGSLLESVKKLVEWTRSAKQRGWPEFANINV